MKKLVHSFSIKKSNEYK
jgi:endonuclease-3